MVFQGLRPGGAVIDATRHCPKVPLTDSMAWRKLACDVMEGAVTITAYVHNTGVGAFRIELQQGRADGT